MPEKRIIKEWLNKNSGFFYTADKTLYEGKTRFQTIELVKTEEFGNVLLLDEITQVVEKNDWQYHEPMVHPALLSHPNPESILVIGGGDGGILREVLRYKSVKSVDFAELDEEVVAFSRDHLPKISGGAFSDPRVRFRFEDGRTFVESKKAEYDVVIMDMTDPSGPSKMLYTREFFTAVKNSLKNERGIFVMHSESPVTRPAAFGCIHSTLRSVFQNVRPLYTFIQMYATLWSFALCSDAGDIDTLTPGETEKRIEASGLRNLKMTSGESIRAMRGEYPYIREILEKTAPVITDAEPDFPDSFSQS